jgi:hypothetical protein
VLLSYPPRPLHPLEPAPNRHTHTSLHSPLNSNSLAGAAFCFCGERTRRINASDIHSACRGLIKQEAGGRLRRLTLSINMSMITNSTTITTYRNNLKKWLADVFEIQVARVKVKKMTGKAIERRLASQTLKAYNASIELNVTGDPSDFRSDEAVLLQMLGEVLGECCNVSNVTGILVLGCGAGYTQVEIQNPTDVTRPHQVCKERRWDIFFAYTLYFSQCIQKVTILYSPAVCVCVCVRYVRRALLAPTSQQQTTRNVYRVLDIPRIFWIPNQLPGCALVTRGISPPTR